MLGSAHRDCKGMHPTQPSHVILRHTRMIRTHCSEEVIKMIHEEDEELNTAYICLQ